MSLNRLIYHSAVIGLSTARGSWSWKPARTPPARLERAYFTRPDGVCRLHFVGVSLAEPPEEAEGAPPVRARLAAQLKAQCDRHLSSLSLQAPPIEGRADGIELFEQSLGPIVQRSVGDQRVLDGVYVKGAGFDATGELVSEGVWVGPRQAALLATLVRAALGMQEKRFIEAGLAWDGMRVLRSDELLRDLRKWVIDDTKAEELLFDRLFFNVLGHSSRALLPGLHLVAEPRFFFSTEVAQRAGQ